MNKIFLVSALVAMSSFNAQAETQSGANFNTEYHDRVIHTTPIQTIGAIDANGRPTLIPKTDMHQINNMNSNVMARTQGRIQIDSALMVPAAIYNIEPASGVMDGAKAMNTSSTVSDAAKIRYDANGNILLGE